VARLGRLGGAEMVSRLVPSLTVRRPVRRSLLLGLAAALASVAAAGPRWGAEPTMVRGSGIDVVLLLDASLSMLAEDERPSRMERMKQEVRRFRALSEGDRIALLAFAGRSYILSPLTVDDGALDLFLDNFDPTVVGQPGSSMSRAITQAVSLLQNTPTESDRAIVLMTDGEGFEPVESITEAARQARDAHIAFVAVGFGTTQGGTIPERTGNTVTQHRDENGQVVVTRYQPEVLRAAAEAVAGALRTSDTAYRYGGEEFVVLLRETGLEDAGEVAERLCAAVRDVRVAGHPVRVTTSAGVAERRSTMAHHTELVAQADAALYAAKAAGRDRVAVAGRRVAVSD
jgi:Ca-activated chloride channel family protein